MRIVLALLLVGCTAEVPLGLDPSDADAEADDPAELDMVESIIAAEPPPTEMPIAAHTTSDDRDGDGIPDATEELLLRRYRPFYKFSQGNGQDESFRPANPIEEMAHAQLREFTGDSGSTAPLPGCGEAGDFHLNPPEQLYTCRPDTSWSVAHQKTTYSLNLENDRYHGVSFDQARAEATGLYGHVAPATINGHAAYKIEYWQFFAFNNQDIGFLGFDSFGDHEGDWTSVQLWFDRTERRIAKVQYLIHGKHATFAIPQTATSCHDCVIEMKGTHYDPNPPNFLAEPGTYSDNSALFYIDGKGFKHVVVYIERGAHEFWPGPWGHAEKSVGPITFHLNPHNGDGPSYLVPDVQDRVLNMGELAHPLTRAGRLILPYDGFWGSTNTKEVDIVGPQRRSPVGPALHCEYKWPDRDPVPGCEG